VFFGNLSGVWYRFLARRPEPRRPKWVGMTSPENEIGERLQRTRLWHLRRRCVTSLCALLRRDG
jgi:hypothetical protein